MPADHHAQCGSKLWIIKVYPSPHSLKLYINGHCFQYACTLHDCKITSFRNSNRFGNPIIDKFK